MNLGPLSSSSKNSRARTSAPRLLYVVAEDWYFLSHRLPMARAARDAGFEVHVATRVTDGAERIAGEQFVLHPVPFVRGRLSLLASLATIRALRQVHRIVEPAVVHHVSLQPTILGSVAALGRPVACVNALTGLGYSFTSNAAKAKAVRRIVGFALGLLLNRKRVISLVQNCDDAAALASLGIAKTGITLIQGSGVDVNRLLPIPEPTGPPTVAFIGRLLDDKGIRTLVVAFRTLRSQRPDLRLLIAGTPDAANPTSVTAEEAAGWNNEPGISWLGHVDDISAVWSRAHLAVLPSRREGLPLSLLEAAACGRPMIATDVPGCREIVIPGETGLLVPVDDAAALAEAINRLATTPLLRAQFAAAARRLVVSRFSTEIIGRKIVELYANLLPQSRLAPVSGGGDSQHPRAETAHAATPQKSGTASRSTR